MGYWGGGGGTNYTILNVKTVIESQKKIIYVNLRLNLPEIFVMLG